MSTLLCARAASAHSPLRFSENLPARIGRTRLRQFVCPSQPVLKKGCRPERANTLTQFASPAQPVLKKDCRPEGANPLAKRLPNPNRSGFLTIPLFFHLFQQLLHIIRQIERALV